MYLHLFNLFCSGLESDNKDLSENKNSKESETLSELENGNINSNFENTNDFISLEPITSEDVPLFQASSLQLTEDLKQILEDDHEKIEIKRTLYSLPSSFSIKKIFDNYFDDQFNDNLNNTESMVSTRNRTSSSKKEIRLIMKEFLASLEMYFNTLLPHYLFYNSEEKQQLKELKESHPNVSFSHLYGFVHLIRMLVILPEFLASTPGLTKKQLDAICKLFQNLINFLSKNKHTF